MDSLQEVKEWYVQQYGHVQPDGSALSLEAYLKHFVLHTSPCLPVCVCSSLTKLHDAGVTFPYTPTVEVVYHLGVIHAGRSAVCAYHEDGFRYYLSQRQRQLFDAAWCNDRSDRPDGGSHLKQVFSSLLSALGAGEEGIPPIVTAQHLPYFLAGVVDETHLPEDPFALDFKSDQTELPSLTARAGAYVVAFSKQNIACAAIQHTCAHREELRFPRLAKGYSREMSPGVFLVRHGRQTYRVHERLVLLRNDTNIKRLLDLPLRDTHYRAKLEDVLAV